MSEYGLVMPFVTVASAGGPHDDESFVVGYECGTWDERLRSSDKPTHLDTVHSSVLAQLDLVAMRHGYTLHRVAGGGEVEGWAAVIFTKDSEG